MNSLQKTQWALDMCPEWLGMLQTACEYQGIEYSRSMAVNVTMNLADKMTMHEDGTVTFTGVTDEDILFQVRSFEEPPPPELHTKVAQLDEAMQILNEQVSDQLVRLTDIVEPLRDVPLQLDRMETENVTRDAGTTLARG